MSNTMQEATRLHVLNALVKSLHQICGRGLYLEGIEDERSSDADSWKNELIKVAQKSISFPNKTSNALDGKPHDVEIRCALGLFHKCIGKKRKRAKTLRVTAESDLGLRRSIESPFELASLLCTSLEESMRYSYVSHDVRSNASGIICLVTRERAQALRQFGRLPCPQCVKWCKGEKGLWWHQQMEHGSEHSIAAATAASEQSVLAIVPYSAEQQRGPVDNSRPPATCTHPYTANDAREEHVFKLVKHGELETLKCVIETNGFDPKHSLDRNGASLLMWAAGCGHLNIVKYLVEMCGCSPSLGQRGRRSFAGRTPLHWASRNGHIHVVKYLVDTCKMDIDATTCDGTTAFCWASWQAHLPVMKCLHESGADAFIENSFGCNAVLWCAQGEGTVETMEWLRLIGLNLLTTNSNGHGALHKAAQRKRRDLCKWLCTSVFEEAFGGNTRSLLHLIGPDTEGFCPSDLAGAAGDEELAVFIAKQEIRLALMWVEREGRSERSTLPEWLQRQYSLSTLVMDENKLNVWEPQGGVRRILLGLVRH